MADISILINKLEQLAEGLETAAEQIVYQAGNNIKALAQKNVEETGVGEYSTSGVPAKWLKDKALNNRGREFVEKAIENGEFITWAALRDVQGLQTAFVDLFYSGEMWQNITVTETKKEGTAWVAVIGGRNQEAANKMAWNRARYGEFILSHVLPDDLEFVNEQAADEIQQLLKRIDL